MQNGDANGHADGGDEGKKGGEEEFPAGRDAGTCLRGGGREVIWSIVERSGVRLPRRGSGAGGANGGDSSANGKAFKHLMEENDDEEGEKGRVAGNDEGEADYCGDTVVS